MKTGVVLEEYRGQDEGELDLFVGEKSGGSEFVPEPAKRRARNERRKNNIGRGRARNGDSSSESDATDNEADEGAVSDPEEAFLRISSNIRVAMKKHLPLVLTKNQDCI